MNSASSSIHEPWRERLRIPNYAVKDAARYAGVATQTVAYWHSSERSDGVLSRRDDRASLSYMQLIEVAVVASFRKAGITLRRIREMREYVSKQLKSEYPFAELKFKTDGKQLLLPYAQVDEKLGREKLLDADGQFVWERILSDRLREFDYETSHELALRWHVGGVGSLVIIDPRVSFGAPAVKGVPTWALKGRWEAGEAVDEIADDFGISPDLVARALEFEGISARNSATWAN